MKIAYLAAATLSLVYIYIVLRYTYYWAKLKGWQVPPGFEPQVFISVLIPARNEAGHIGTCLKTVLNQTYPPELYEVIVIDDHSDDGTPEAVKRFLDQKLKLIELSELPGSPASKKKALETGIRCSKGQLIVTTDADCKAGPDWLRTIASFYELSPVRFIAAPVNFYDEQSLFEKFQSLDFLGMMGVTGAGIEGQFMNMCNGANLAYEKKVFKEVGGFEGIDHLASGDDMLLMQKVARRFPGKTGFLKSTDAVVLTGAQSSLAAFISQRLRWASKSASYKEWQVILILAIVFAFCLSIILSFILIPFFGLEMLLLFTGQLLIKTVSDYFFLGRMARYFRREDLMRAFLPAQFLHIVYIAGIGFLAQVVKKYTWKGRQTA